MNAAESIALLLEEPILQAAIGRTPTYADVDTALREFGVPCYQLAAETTACIVNTGELGVIRIEVPMRSNPAGAALTCLLYLLKEHYDFNVAAQREFLS